MVNEMRAGFFRNRNDSVAVPYFTNAEFGIQNPFADQVPDLSQITIDGDDVGGELRFGTLGDGRASSIVRRRGPQATRFRSRAEAIRCAWAASFVETSWTAICRKHGTAATTSTRGWTS